MNKNIKNFINSTKELYPDTFYGNGYRCSAYLYDGTFLPCVMLRESKSTIQQAILRLEKEKSGESVFTNVNGYEEMIKIYTTYGNRVDECEILKCKESRYAIPLDIIKEIGGETTMSWNAFVLEMNDGQYFSFGSNYLLEFFDLPKNYTFEDVVQVHNDSYVSTNGKPKKLQEGYMTPPTDYDLRKVYREKPYFVCYTDI